MIIEKIELDNFMCYSGPDNVINLTEGINVIIGDNGYGKSQLYNAFYWVMYDQIFMKEQDRFVYTKDLQSAIISDKAKHNAKEGKVSAAVKITFRNLERDNVYVLERKYTATVSNGKLIESNDGEFTIVQKELTYLNGKLINDEDRKQAIKASILPSDLKPYLWFQGEQVESIIDFNKHDSLTRAINVLSSIKRYDELKEIAAASAKSANTEYDRELRRLSKDTDKSSQLQAQKLKLEKQIAESQKEEDETNENLSRAEARCDELLNKQVDAQKVSELQERKKGILISLNQLNESLKEEEVNFHKKMFRNKWILKGTANLQKDYAKKFSEYESKKLLEAAEKVAKEKLENEAITKLQTRLPFNVPEPNYLEWMLDKQRCLVCNREAKKDSEAWKSIKELLDRPNNKQKIKNDEPSTAQNFTDDLKRLYQNGLSLSNRIDDIDDDINETLKQKEKFRSKVRDTNKQMEKLEADIQKLLSDASLTTEEATNIRNEFVIQNNKSKDFRDKLTKLTQQIEHYKSSLKNIDEQLKSLVTGEIPKWLVEKREVLNDFEELTKTTRDRVFSNLVSQLEKEANIHYQAMTTGNKSARGQIKLRKMPNSNYMPEIVDNHGVPLLGSNTSNLILVKLAAIMAIVSAKSNSGFANLYTLIADAPTSVFGEDYTIGFTKTISKIYRQSIIMSKEFYKNQQLRDELLTNSEIKIGKVYTITPSSPSSERENRYDLSTKIHPLN